MTALGLASSGASQKIAAGRTQVAVFTATLFLSAALLFGIQPMFTKMVLPRLGGSPSVWSVAMVFFQTALLAGYLYAHLSTRYLRFGWAVSLHLCLLAAAFISLPIGVAGGFGRPPEDGQATWLIGLLTMSVGLPFVALAGNAPLLQAWFVRSGHPNARNPYFLYRGSNIGSTIRNCPTFASQRFARSLKATGGRGMPHIARSRSLALSRSNEGGGAG